MNNYERIQYNNFINNLYFEKGLADLEEFATFLEEKKIELASVKEAFITAEYNRYIGSINILKQNYYEYIETNISTLDRKGSSFRSLGIAFSSLNGKNHREMLICDILGFNKEDIMKHKNVGDSVINKLERTLNSDGLSLFIIPEVAQMLTATVYDLPKDNQEQLIRKKLKFSEEI